MGRHGLGGRGSVAAAIGLLAFAGTCTRPGGASRTVPAELDGSNPTVDPQILDRYAEMALACIEREYPNKLAHVLASDDDVRPPRALTPAFYGCFDWHSAVHGHWLLARLLQREDERPWSAAARTALARNLAPSRIAGELAYLAREDRSGFERPYGLAWLLQLGAELRAWDDPDARAWANALAPLEAIAAARLGEWLTRLSHPIRVGEHSQTAFAMGLALDWARSVGDEAFAALLVARARAFYGEDRGCPLAFEPSGHDFLSPCLAEADLMRRVLPPVAFAAWLDRALPRLGREPLPPTVAIDRSDGKLVHLDGLALSRAWMLTGVAHGLPVNDPRQAGLRADAAKHARLGLSAVSADHYAGGHWLGSFAVYLVTAAGRAPR